jgi:hypothetical protein
VERARHEFYPHALRRRLVDDNRVPSVVALPSVLFLNGEVAHTLSRRDKRVRRDSTRTRSGLDDSLCRDGVIRKGFRLKGEQQTMRIAILLLSVLMVSVDGAGAGQSSEREASRQPAPPGTSSSSGPKRNAVFVARGYLSNDKSKFELRDEESGRIYDLVGREAELAKHVGDELDVSGLKDASPAPQGEDSLPETTLRVRSLTTLVHQNPDGVRPVLGGPASRVSFGDTTYGIRFRYPVTFKPLKDGDTGVESAFVLDGAITLQGLSAGSEIYPPKSNFSDVSFAAFVNPTIRSEKICRQFYLDDPGEQEKGTSIVTINGVQFAETEGGDAGMGQRYSMYHLHAYQNGFCYEFSFTFHEHNPLMLDPTCSFQSVNEWELMKAVLSQLSFVPPVVKPAVGDRPAVSAWLSGFDSFAESCTLMLRPFRAAQENAMNRLGLYSVVAFVCVPAWGIYSGNRSAHVAPVYLVVLFVAGLGALTFYRGLQQ